MPYFQRKNYLLSFLVDGVGGGAKDGDASPATCAILTNLFLVAHPVGTYKALTVNTMFLTLHC
jgi:hypothetical protein